MFEEDGASAASENCGKLQRNRGPPDLCAQTRIGKRMLPLDPRGDRF